MKELSRGAQRLFDLARAQDAPEPGTDARVERALAARIALGVGAGAASMTAAPAAAASKLGSATLASIAGKALVVGLATGSVAIGTASVVHSVMTPENAGQGRAGPPARVEAQVPARAVGAPARADSERAGTTRQDGRAREIQAVPLAPGARRSARASSLDHDPATGRGASPMPEHPLDAETESLREAQSALRDREFDRALALLDDQDAQFGGGSLEQERAAARVLASCLSGRVERARAEAAHFERRWPRSPLLARVRRSCSEP